MEGSDERRPNRLDRRDLVIGIVVVALTAFVGVALVLQGWRARLPDNELGLYITAALDLVETGRVPEHGVITSFRSYAPPGLAWLYVPGVLATSDARLVGKVSSVLLHVGTLTGIFLLARRAIRTRQAALAVLLYGVSSVGLYHAGELWARGLPFFFVWMAYWTCRWGVTGRPVHLGLSLITWAAGTYSFMELAPAIVAVPAVWYLSRRPVPWRTVALVTGVAAVMWFPYLRFESERGFIDLRSQILRQSIQPLGAWCDPAMPFLQAGAAQAVPTPTDATVGNRVVRAAGRQLLGGASALVANFTSHVPGASAALAAITLLGLLMLAGPRGPGWNQSAVPSTRWPWTALGVTLCAVAVLANDVVIERLLAALARGNNLASGALTNFQLVAALAGVVILLRRRVATISRALSARFAGSSGETVMVASCLAAPWLVQLLVSEHSRPERLGWLLPLQVIAMAAVLGAIRTPGRFAIGAVVMVGCMADIPSYWPAATLSPQHWSGRDHVTVPGIASLADRLKARGQRDVSIGYFESGPPLLTIGNQVAPALDLLLRANGIRNSNQCPEGVSIDDEILLTWSEGDVEAPLPVPVHELIAEFGPYQAYSRAVR